jgi:uncharacterized protein involved in tolerance to divalent cations
MDSHWKQAVCIEIWNHALNATQPVACVNIISQIDSSFRWADSDKNVE